MQDHESQQNEHHDTLGWTVRNTPSRGASRNAARLSNLVPFCTCDISGASIFSGSEGRVAFQSRTFAPIVVKSCEHRTYLNDPWCQHL